MIIIKINWILRKISSWIIVNACIEMMGTVSRCCRLTGAISVQCLTKEWRLMSVCRCTERVNSDACNVSRMRSGVVGSERRLTEGCGWVQCLKEDCGCALKEDCIYRMPLLDAYADPVEVNRCRSMRMEMPERISTVDLDAVDAVSRRCRKRSRQLSCVEALAVETRELRWE